jgi:transposase
VSRYYQWRKGVRVAAVTYPKLTAVCDLETHFVLAAHVSLGPCVDQPQFKPAMIEAVAVQPIARLLGDKGYDAEHNHALCREQLGIDITVIPAKRNCKRTREWPLTKYRREMRPKKNRSDYGQRWQIESAFSRHKRLLGAALRSRTWDTQQWEVLARVLTHDIMLLAAA